MARKRMIDPNIWQSEDFGSLSDLAKLIFIGLFSLADDEGRGRCNPVYLKSTLFPYKESLRSADVEVALSEISRTMSVVFYSCDEKSYYSLYNWSTWQKIDKPTDSKIPAFDENDKTIRRIFDEGSTRTSRRVAPNRIEKNKNRIEQEENRKRIVDAYNLYCTNLPQVQKLTDKREKAIDKFLKEFTVEQFEEICKKANISDFLIGKNDRKWKADFDFLMRIDKATSILEDKYSEKGTKDNGQSNKYNGVDLSKNLYKGEGEVDDTGLI